MKVLRPLKAIRAKCLDCCAGSPAEVRLCASKNCTLWPYRLGKRPKVDELSTDEEETSDHAPTCIVEAEDGGGYDY